MLDPPPADEGSLLRLQYAPGGLSIGDPIDGARMIEWPSEPFARRGSRTLRRGAIFGSLLLAGVWMFVAGAGIWNWTTQLGHPWSSVPAYLHAVLPRVPLLPALSVSSIPLAMGGVFALAGLGPRGWRMTLRNGGRMEFRYDATKGTYAIDAVEIARIVARGRRLRLKLRYNRGWIGFGKVDCPDAASARRLADVIRLWIDQSHDRDAVGLRNGVSRG